MLNENERRKVCFTLTGSLELEGEKNNIFGIKID